MWAETCYWTTCRRCWRYWVSRNDSRSASGAGICSRPRHGDVLFQHVIGGDRSHIHPDRTGRTREFGRARCLAWDRTPSITGPKWSSTGPRLVSQMVVPGSSAVSPGGQESPCALELRRRPCKLVSAVRMTFFIVSTSIRPSGQNRKPSTWYSRAASPPNPQCWLRGFVRMFGDDGVDRSCRPNRRRRTCRRPRRMRAEARSNRGSCAPNRHFLQLGGKEHVVVEDPSRSTHFDAGRVRRICWIICFVADAPPRAVMQVGAV